MMLSSTLRTVGGSVMLAIPKPVLDMLGLSVNDKVTLHIDEGRLVLEPLPRRRYTLDDLLAQCDVDASPAIDSVIWDATEPVGREVI